MKLKTHACAACERPVVLATTDEGRVILDPSTPVYVRESDGEGKGETVVARDRSGLVMARHACRRDGGK